MRVAAVDLGATSGRVCVAEFANGDSRLDVVHRFAHQPVAANGSLRWDWTRLVDEVRRGLATAREAGPLASIGVDTWGVDYGLIDDEGAGNLVAPPYSYRDSRTAGWRETAERIGEERLYTTTGIQAMPINTIFQLAVHDRDELASARTLLMLPELLVRELSHDVRGELTSAGTTGLVDLRTGGWSHDLIAAVGLEASLFPTIGRAGQHAGAWEGEHGVPVHLVGGHDTASAVLAAPRGGAGRVFVATGSWLLVGVERDTPDVSPEARRLNFSNEPGVFGGVRFLKNVSGLALLERCRHRWGGPPIEQLLQAAATSRADAVVDPDAAAEALDVEGFVREAARLPVEAGPGDVVRVLLLSLARRVAAVVTELATLLPDPPTEIAMVGGGVRIGLLREMIAAATGLPVSLGPAEASAWGNAIAQGLALGEFATLDEARQAISAGS
ncbi:MAG TPA: FGGY-family carbohydrate kinase [Mycobacteriales bacterium]|nr:FGGY-family carbohydrate kinase [Mycobacteriales bacterium]